MTTLKEIKNWNVEIEKEITKKWKDSKQFSFDKKTKKEIYSIDTPPPYVNAPIHMGHAVTYCFMDFFARYKRMKGFEVLFPLGLDRNGLPIEMAAEKKYKISPFKIGREKFIEYCKKLLSESSAESIDSFAKLGISFSSYKEGKNIGDIYNTDSPEYRKVTQKTFVDLYKKGRIYEDSRINNWDLKLQTTIADSEINREEKETNLNYVAFNVKEIDEEIIIATTRPELLCTSALIIYNPKDERYKHLKGKKAITPIFNNEVEIIEHTDADPEFGTGIVFMSSSGGDQDAVRFLRKVGIKAVSSINKLGKMNEHGGFLEGLSTRDARKEMITKLKEKGYLKKQEKIIHSVPISERSKAEIEFIEMPEFYLRQLDIKKEIKKITKKINFYPKESKKMLDLWIDNIAIDWPLSRRRYYATPIPLWYSEEKVALSPGDKYVEPFKKAPPKNAEVIHKETRKLLGKVSNFPDAEWKGEERVLDTWFDSSISELQMLQYKKDDNFFKKSFPATLRPQGKDIVRTWLYYTILRGYLEKKKPSFKDVWIHQHILDQSGRKMSKSLGNIINPLDILNEEGSEALRFWASIEGDLSKIDISCSREKIRAEKKSLNKLLNIAKFVMQFEKPKKSLTITKTDEIFINHIEMLTDFCDKSYEKYDFNHPAQNLRKFLWDTFASNYIELIKSRAYNEEKKFSEEESNSAKYTLYYLLERLITLLYPIIPQITTTISKELKIDLLSLDWPKVRNIGIDSPKLVNKIIEFNSKVWKAKKEKEISLKSPIKKIKIPSDLKPFEKDLIACHNLE